MKVPNWIIAAFLAVTVAGASNAAAQGRSVVPPASPMEAKLVIPDTKLLPGVPFEMWIEVRNPSDATVGVGLCADMIVRPEGGEPFTISFGGEHRPPYPTLLPERDWTGPSVANLTLKPRAAQTLTVPILPELAGPLYFEDDRLSKPGRYGISLRLDYCWPGFVTPQKSLLPPEFLGAVTTNEVTIERITPTGSDAAVWQRMQELTDGKWVSIGWLTSRNSGARNESGATAGMTVVNEIITKYPDSNYFPYALLAAQFGAVDAASYNRYVDAIKRFPNSPVAELLELSAMGTAATTGRLLAQNAHFEKVKKSKRPTTRIRAFGREDLPPEPCPPGDTCED